MLTVNLEILLIKNMGKLTLNTKTIFLITHLLETEGNFGNKFDQDLKKNVA